jgi:glycosyltransferase involved in cell wall biosynthesis
MRILHVVPSYWPAVRYGGPIFAVHSLCRALARLGHDVEVFTTNIDGAGVSNVPIEVPVTLDGVRIRYFSAERWRRLYWAPRLGQALKQDVGHVDVVHAHSVFLWPTWAASHFSRRADVPYLISPRGMLVKEMVERRSRLAKRIWIELFERKNLKMAAAIHATSALEATELQRFGWRLPRIAVIPNVVDQPDDAVDGSISRDVREAAARLPFALFLGRISWKKGLDRLLRAFARTRLGRLVIVGPNDELLLPELIRLAGELQMSDRVHFLARAVSGPDKAHLYSSAQLFVLPSYSENFGNTVLEAMQYAKPVVVTPEVGAAEIVRKAKCGLVVEGDPEPLGEAIDRLMTNSSLAGRMGEAGRRHIVQHFEWRTVGAQMEALYDDIIRTRERGPELSQPSDRSKSNANERD